MDRYFVYVKHVQTKRLIYTDRRFLIEARILLHAKVCAKLYTYHVDSMWRQLKTSFWEIKFRKLNDFYLPMTMQKHVVVVEELFILNNSRQFCNVTYDICKLILYARNNDNLHTCIYKTISDTKYTCEK